MKSVIYDGNSDAVEIRVSNGEFILAKRGEPVDVPDSVAKSLLLQDIFSEPNIKLGGK